MLKIRVIPCMLFNGSAIIKTKQFGERRTLGNPIQFARVYNARNVDELIFIDMTATGEGREPMFEIIKGVSEQCFMPLSIGGGIHNIETIRRLLQSGADKVVINSGAADNVSLVEAAAQTFGSQCVVVSIDAKKNSDGSYGVYVDHGRRQVETDVAVYAKKMEAHGAGEVFLTSIDNDGMMEGCDIDLIKQVSSAVKLPIIACGGVGRPQHVVDVIKNTHIGAVAMASIFHYTKYTPNDIKRELQNNNFLVRKIV